MTIIRVEYDSVRYDLDVLESTPIRLDISAIENNEIGEIFGAASQTFTLPGSKKNNQFFKHAYKVGTEVVPGLNESVRCWVISESDTLLEGSLFLDSVVKTANEGVNYEVTIVNNVITFNETIKTTRVKDLKWSEPSITNPATSGFDHSFSSLNVTSSWDTDIFGAIYYPLIDQGRDGSETTGSLPNVAIGDGVGFINSTNTPLKVNQLTPAVKVKTILDLIFEQGEFTYETSLTDLFNQTYILPKQTETLAVKGSGFSGFGFIAGSTSDQIIAASTSWTTVQFNSESFDETNAYNTSTYTYTTPVQGTYNFKSIINYAIDPEDTSATLQVRLRNTTDNTTLSSVSFNPTTLTGSFELETGKINVGQQKALQLQFRYTQGGGQGLLDATIETGSSFQTLETPLNWETGIIKMGEQFDPQVKCIDIIRGISQKFNLVFEPDYNKNRVIKIESYNDWVKNGNRKDWTQKIQNAERIFLKSPLSSQPKTLEFQDAKDNDKLSKQVIDNAEGLQWGTAIVDAISDVPQGEKKVGEYFAPIVLETIPGAITSDTDSVYPYIPQLYKTDDTQVERKTFKFKPRIGYKVNGTLPETCYIGNSVTPFTSYATISNYDTLPIVSGSTKNLHWNETFYPPTFNASATGSITAYDEYWSNYVNDLYRDDNKILKADIYFEPYELRDIKLNDAIFVEDSYYRINKISGYNVNNPDVVSVELIGLSSGDIPSVDINCNFDFEWGLTTSTSTLIPPVQPTTIPPSTTTTTTTTAAPKENVTFALNNFLTGSVGISRVVFENNNPDLFVLENTAGQTTAVTQSEQILLGGVGGVNTLTNKWIIDPSGSDLVRYDYTQSLFLDGVFAGQQAGNIYNFASESNEFVVGSNIDLSQFDTYTVTLNLRQFSAPIYTRNVELDFNNQSTFDVDFSRIRFSSNPIDLFRVNNIGQGTTVSSSNVDIAAPNALNSIRTDFSFDYPGTIIFDYTASLLKDGVITNTISASGFQDPGTTTELIIDGGTDISAFTSYSVEWELRSGSSQDFLYYTNVGLSGSIGNFQRVGNSRSTVCSQSALPSTDFAFTTESLGVGVQLYNNAALTVPFEFTPRSGDSTFRASNYIKLIKPYSTAPYTGSSYRIDENGIIIAEWPCDHIWVPFRYNQPVPVPPSDTLEFNFITPFNEVEFGTGEQSGSIIAQRFYSPVPNDTYFVSLVDSNGLWSPQIGTVVELSGSANTNDVFNGKIIQNVNPATKIQTSLDGYVTSGSYNRLPTFQMIANLTGSILDTRAFDRYIDIDDRLTYFPSQSNLQMALVSPADYSRPSSFQFNNGWIDDFTSKKSVSAELNKNTFYNTRAEFNYPDNSIQLFNSNPTPSNNQGALKTFVSSSFQVKAMSIVFAKDNGGDEDQTLFNLGNMGTANNAFSLGVNGINTSSGSAWQSGSFFVWDQTTNTHYDGGETNNTNLIGTGSEQYPGPNGIQGAYGKRVFTFNLNPNRVFETFVNRNFIIGGSWSGTTERAAFQGKIYGVFIWDTELTYTDHKNLTNELITKGIISGSIV